MTKAYDRLSDAPQVGLDLGALAPDERASVRSIAVTTGQSSKTPGTYSTLYYLPGDEREAVRRFIEENRGLLEQVDFSKRNAVQANLDRAIYDLLLHEFGERGIDAHATVVLETRPDGTRYLIDRDKFDHHNARYRLTEGRTARTTRPLREIYDQLDSPITEDDLKSVEGDVRQVLDYYRVAEDFECAPTAVDGQLAVRKRP